MDNSILSKVTSTVINKSEELDFSFLDIDLTPETLSSDHRRVIFNGRNLTECHLSYVDSSVLREYSTRLEIKNSNISNVVLDLNVQSNNLDLSNITAENLTINLEAEGKLSHLMLQDIRAKTVRIVQTPSHKESSYSSAKEMTILLSEHNHINELIIESEEVDVEHQLKVSFRGGDYSNSIINVLRLKNLTFKDADSYYDSSEESPEIIIHSLELINVSSENEMNIRYINSRLDFLKSRDYGQETDESNPNHLEGLANFTNSLNTLLKDNDPQALMNIPELTPLDIENPGTIEKLNCCRFQRRTFKMKINSLLASTSISESVRNEVLSGVVDRVVPQNKVRVFEDALLEINKFLYELCHINEAPYHDTVPVFKFTPNGNVTLENSSNINMLLRNYSYTSLMRLKRNSVNPSETVNSKAYREYQARGGDLSESNFHSIHNTDRADILFREIPPQHRQRLHQEYNNTVGLMSAEGYESMYHTIANVPPGMLHPSQEVSMYSEWERRNADSRHREQMYRERMRVRNNPGLRRETFSELYSQTPTMDLNIVNAVSESVNNMLAINRSQLSAEVQGTTRREIENSISPRLSGERVEQERVRFDPGEINSDPFSFAEQFQLRPNPRGDVVWLDTEAFIEPSDIEQPEINIFGNSEE